MSIAELIDSGLLPPDFKEYIDAGEGVKRVAGNQAIYIRLLKSYLSSPEFEKLKAQTQSGEIEVAAAIAHGIKGIAGNLSLAKLYEVIVEFEGQLKRGVYEQDKCDLFFQTDEKTRDYVKILIEKFEA
ncbi:MAG: hypothetical protein LBL49_03170 [Clostridiales Family XIII bacterium]|jgi:HPt (histidine-containing phosphotransfer) domain-containing protein|nr:hypothetical protein [Clostridiales Family XIII bacterium]